MKEIVITGQINNTDKDNAVHKVKVIGAQILEKNVLIVNHKINNRYGTDGISTHDKTKCDNSIKFHKT